MTTKTNTGNSILRGRTYVMQASAESMWIEYADTPFDESGATASWPGTKAYYDWQRQYGTYHG